MLYTQKGDKGKTELFCCDQKLTKGSLVAEALGSVDEINSLLGWCKIKAFEKNLFLGGKNRLAGEVIDKIQNDLFSIQAEIAGADKKISPNRVKFLETITDEIEKELPAIKSFFVAGGTELSAMFDFARAVARRAERQVTAAGDVGELKLKLSTKAYLNRLSSILYALARVANFRAGLAEKPPVYK